MVDRQLLTAVYHPHDGGGPPAIGWQSVGGMPVTSDGGPPAIDSGV